MFYPASVFQCFSGHQPWRLALWIGGAKRSRKLSQDAAPNGGREPLGRLRRQAGEQNPAAQAVQPTPHRGAVAHADFWASALLFGALCFTAEGCVDAGRSITVLELALSYPAEQIKSRFLLSGYHLFLARIGPYNLSHWAVSAVRPGNRIQQHRPYSPYPTVTTSPPESRADSQRLRHRRVTPHRGSRRRRYPFRRSRQKPLCPRLERRPGSACGSVFLRHGGGAPSGAVGWGEQKRLF